MIHATPPVTELSKPRPPHPRFHRADRLPQLEARLPAATHHSPQTTNHKPHRSSHLDQLSNSPQHSSSPLPQASHLRRSSPSPCRAPPAATVPSRLHKTLTRSPSSVHDSQTVPRKPSPTDPTPVFQTTIPSNGLQPIQSWHPLRAGLPMIATTAQLRSANRVAIAHSAPIVSHHCPKDSPRTPTALITSIPPANLRSSSSFCVHQPKLNQTIFSCPAASTRTETTI